MGMNSGISSVSFLESLSSSVRPPCLKIDRHAETGHSASCCLCKTFLLSLLSVLILLILSAAARTEAEIIYSTGSFLNLLFKVKILPFYRFVNATCVGLYDLSQLKHQFIITDKETALQISVEFMKTETNLIT